MSPAELFAGCRDGLTHVVTVNAEIFVLAHENRTYGELLQETVNTIDGRVLQWICKAFYPRQRIVRLAGSNFIHELAEYCGVRREQLFLLGSTTEANRRAVSALSRRVPGLVVEGFSPRFHPDIDDRDWNAEILPVIEAFHPRHLVVCFGPPKQELWIHRNHDRLCAAGVRVAYGLGGTIDFMAGVRRAPPGWVQTIGAGWLYRWLHEPRARFARTLTMFRMPWYAARTQRLVRAVPEISA